VRAFPGKSYSFFLIKEFLKVFFVSIIFIMGLSFIVRTLQKLNPSKTYSFFQILIIRFLEAPEIISRETLLASCMFASVYTMSKLSKNREILALRSLGISVYKIILPLILLGFIICISSLAFEDLIVVKSILWKDSYISKIKGVQKRKYFMDRNNIIVFGKNNVVYQIEKKKKKKNEMVGIMIIKKNEYGNIKYRIDAEKGRWDGKRWVFLNGIYRSFDDSGEIENSKTFLSLETQIRDAPKYFTRDRRRLENMTFREAYQYIRMIKRMGFNYRGLLTRFNRKLANGFTLFLVIIIGLSLGSMPFKNVIVISFSLTLGIVLVFFFVIEIGYTFGSTGKIPPVIGGWLGNIIFSLISVYLLRSLRV